MGLILLLGNLLRKGARHYYLVSRIIRQELGLGRYVLDSASEASNDWADWWLCHNELLARSACLSAIILALGLRRDLTAAAGVPHASVTFAHAYGC